MSGAIGTFAVGQTPIGGSYYQTYTVQRIINLALKGAGLLGVGQSALTEDITDTLDMLNGMIGQWNRKRWIIWHLIDISVPTTGAKTYSIGIGGDYDFPRPDRIEAAYYRQFVSATPINYIDFPLGILQSMEDYSRIALKGLSSWPYAIFYDSAFPIGYLYPYPIPQAGQFELHIIIKDRINQFRDLTASINLPEEFFEAIWSNLAIRLGAFYPGANVTEFTVNIAKQSLATIRSANTQVPRLVMPNVMVRPPLYNIYSGSQY